MLKQWLSIFPFLLLCAGACQHKNTSDNNFGNVQTTLHLKNWGLMILEEIEAGTGDAYFFGPLDKVLAKCKTEKPDYIVYLREYQEDFWQRSLVKETRTEAGIHYLRILSAGANGKHEVGKGDDLFLELVWDGRKKVRGKVEFVTAKGSREHIIVGHPKE